MPDITVRKETHELFRHFAVGNFVDTSRDNGDGTFTFPVSEEVYTALLALSEDIDEAVKLALWRPKDEDR